MRTTFVWLLVALAAVSFTENVNARSVNLNADLPKEKYAEKAAPETSQYTKPVDNNYPPKQPVEEKKDYQQPQQPVDKYQPAPKKADYVEPAPYKKADYYERPPSRVYESDPYYSKPAVRNDYDRSYYGPEDRYARPVAAAAYPSKDDRYASEPVYRAPVDYAAPVERKPYSSDYTSSYKTQPTDYNRDYAPYKAPAVKPYEYERPRYEPEPYSYPKRYYEDNDDEYYRPPAPKSRKSKSSKSLTEARRLEEEYRRRLAEDERIYRELEYKRRQKESEYRENERRLAAEAEQARRAEEEYRRRLAEDERAYREAELRRRAQEEEYERRRKAYGYGGDNPAVIVVPYGGGQPVEDNDIVYVQNANDNYNYNEESMKSQNDAAVANSNSDKKENKQIKDQRFNARANYDLRKVEVGAPNYADQQQQQQPRGDAKQKYQGKN